MAMQFPSSSKLIQRTLVVCSLLLVQLPLFAEDMWTSMFEENLEGAQSGDPEAQYEVAIMYLKGQGTRADRGKAVDWLQKASAQDHEQSASKLHRMKENQKKFKELILKAESGTAKTQYEVAQMYIRGKGVPINYKEARGWLEKANEQGYQKATTRLGIFHYKGEGGKPNYKKAKKLLVAAASDSTLAQYYLGDMYASGNGVAKDYRTAVDWYQKSADGGFNRALGKVINMEEEIKMQERRRARLEQEKLQAPEPVAKKKPVRKSSKKTPVKVAKASKVTPKPRKKAAAPRKKKPKLSLLDRLNKKHWSRNKRPVDFLPSNVTECEQDAGKLVCFSREVERADAYQTVRYRVKSEITPGKTGFSVKYMNLVIDVTEHDTDSDEDVLAYDDESEQGFKIKTGWTKEHTVVCKPNGNKKLDCVKDKAHKMSLVAG